MPRNPTGVFDRVSNSFSEPIINTVIDPVDAIELWEDYDLGMTDSLSRTGEGGMQANLDMGGNDINAVDSVSFAGSLSGAAVVRAPAAAGTTTLTLPGVTGNLALASAIVAESFGAVGNGTTDNTTAIQAAFDAAEAAGGGIVLFGPGVFRVNSQLTIDGSGITIMGCGKGGPDANSGTTLDLRAAAHKILVGNGATRRNQIRFTNFNVVDGAGTAFYVFETRFVRGISWDNISIGSTIYAFAKLGRPGEPTSFYNFNDGIEGNLAAVSQHFIDAVNAPGPGYVAGSVHVEGPDTVVAGSCFINYDTTSAAVDGLQVLGVVGRQFDRGVNLRPGCANVIIADNIFDEMKTYGIYADTDVGAINGLQITGNRINGDDVTVTSSGVVVHQSTLSAQGIKINDNLIYEWGDEGIWVDDSLDVTINDNTVANTGQRTNNSFAAIRVSGTTATGVISDNYITSTSANKIQYGVLNASTSASLSVRNNPTVGAQTAAVSGFHDEARFKATMSAAQTGIADDTVTKVNFDTESYDVGANYDTTNKRWTPGAGTVTLSVTVFFDTGAAAGNQSAVSIYKNGSELASHIPRMQGTNNFSVTLTVQDESDNNDFYEVFAKIDTSGGTWSILNGSTLSYFMGRKL